MLFSRKDLIKIIVPLLIEQCLGVTIGLADSMMVASAGEAAVSGVSLVDTVNLFLMYIFTALGTGGAVICSQYVGKKDYEAARGAAKQLLYSITAVSLCVMLVTLTFHGALLKLIFGKIEANVMSNARIYFLLTALSYPFLALQSGCGGVLRSVGDSKTAMLVSTTVNLLNVAGNAVFIFGLGLGAAGAALGTLIARVVGSLIILRVVHNKNRVIYIDRLFRFKPDFGAIKRILHIGVPSGLENGMFQLGKILTQSLISSMGTAVIAANAVANTLSSFQYALGGAFSLTIMTVVGTCIGAGAKEEARQYTKKLLLVEYAMMIVLSAGLALAAKPIIGLYNLSDTSAKIALELILFHCLGIITFWPIAFSLPNAFRAASDVRFSMVVSIISMWTFRVALSYVLEETLHLGAMSVWSAMMVDWVFRASFFIIHFLRGKWLQRYDVLESKRALKKAAR